MVFARDSVIFDVILAPTYNPTPSLRGGGSMKKMISLDDDEEHIWKFLTKFDGVHKFVISLILKSFEMLFSNHECHILSFSFYENEKRGVPS
jgi:hypothetical protein